MSADHIPMPFSPAIAVAIRNRDGRLPQAFQALDDDLLAEATSSELAEALSDTLPELRRLVRDRVRARRAVGKA